MTRTMRMIWVLLALLTVLSVSSVASADAIFSGSTGPPIMMGSNSGSAQGQAHRSATGTFHKITNDGWATHPPLAI